jgi:hypothetical protein
MLPSVPPFWPRWSRSCAAANGDAEPVKLLPVTVADVEAQVAFDDRLPAVQSDGGFHRGAEISAVRRRRSRRSVKPPRA